MRSTIRQETLQEIWEAYLANTEDGIYKQIRRRVSEDRIEGVLELILDCCVDEVVDARTRGKLEVDK